ncbi:hypothetical protein JIG36_35575 [Actinoplanes sp. LDG1-06]|uniref:Secreted protein n=1 Tax=Paractinoplanes ovalisporus TaxID=2810368 RepID=A0ABS2ALT9_9ACTN|nr:hypothetical protein [Actinoplanes ovalisporus]MBM2620834.1 hypothetical protein [Actinoplanes ovalisporus]
MLRKTGSVAKKAASAGVLVGAGAAIALLLPSVAPAATTYFSKTTKATGSGSVSCPVGSKVTGGGVNKLPSNSYGSSSSTEYILVASYPNGEGWKGEGRVVRGSRSSSGDWRYTSGIFMPPVFAICIR